MTLYDKLVYCIFYNTRNLGNILDYFVEYSNDVYVYIYPSTNKNAPTIFMHYQKGNLIHEKKIFWYKGNNKTLIHLFYNIYFLYIFLYFRIRGAYVVVNYPLFSFFTIPLKFLANTVVLHVGDYFPNRTGLLKLYGYMLNFCISQMKYLIFSSQKLYETYQEEVNIRKSQVVNIINLGLKASVVERSPKENLLGFLGNLRHNQGLEIIFDTLQNNKTYRLDVVGVGQMLDYYKNLAKSKGVEKRVHFHGFVEDADLPALLSNWQIALAPYEPSKDNLTFYTEPSKVKLYVEFELPVVMTRVTYMYEELEKYNAGVVVDYNEIALAGGVNKLLMEYSKYQNGVKKLKKKYYYKDKYNKGYAFIQTKGA